jgi:hypothetical protein
LDELLRAAPGLLALHADAICTICDDACLALRNDAPFGRLRMHALCVKEVDADGAHNLAAQLAECTHASLKELSLYEAELYDSVALGALVDGVRLCGLHTLELSDCNLTPGSVPALARLLRGGSTLRTLNIDNGRGQAGRGQAAGRARRGAVG